MQYSAVQVALAGAAGGVIRWLTLRGRLWPDGMINITVGAICATYMTPIVLPLIEASIGRVMAHPDQVVGFSAFMVGVGGLTVSDFIIEFWRRWARRMKDD